MNNWDKWYLDVCNVIAKNSKCLSRKIGAIIARDKSIIAQGYNGPPRGIPHCGYKRYEKDKYLQEMFKNEQILMKYTYEKINAVCPRYLLGYKSGEGLHICIAGHAETSAIFSAARNGICIKDTTLYLNTCIPCKNCLISIINAGIKEIVCTSLKVYDEQSNYLLEQSNLAVRTFDVE